MPYGGSFRRKISLPCFIAGVRRQDSEGRHEFCGDVGGERRCGVEVANEFREGDLDGEVEV